VVLEALAAVADPGTLNLADATQIINVPTRLLMTSEVTPETRPDTTRAESAPDIGIVPRFEGDDTETADANSPGCVEV